MCVIFFWCCFVVSPEEWGSEWHIECGEVGHTAEERQGPSPCPYCWPCCPVLELASQERGSPWTHSALEEKTSAGQYGMISFHIKKTSKQFPHIRKGKVIVMLYLIKISTGVVIDFHGFWQTGILLNQQQPCINFLYHIKLYNWVIALHNNSCLQLASFLQLLPASWSLRSDSSEGSSLGERGRGRWESEARSPREISVHM